MTKDWLLLLSAAEYKFNHTVKTENVTVILNFCWVLMLPLSLRSIRTLYKVIFSNFTLVLFSQETFISIGAYKRGPVEKIVHKLTRKLSPWPTEHYMRNRKSPGDLSGAAWSIPKKIMNGVLDKVVNFLRPKRTGDRGRAG